MNSIETYEKNHLKELSEGKVFPKFSSGDTLKVHLKVKEGEKERIQVFEGICIAKKNAGINSSFTVRKISYGEGIERVLPLYSPQISKIELVKSGDVRRSKLYYLRTRSGRSARISEKSTYSENLNTKKEEEKVLENSKVSTNAKNDVNMEEKGDNKVDSNEKVDLENKK
ncbi:MAG: 50S ribosomal protein L19 [Rickettsiales bacterium]|nr:50S ribosomal protein L19 [Rickettsiales bacterium]